MIRNQEDRVAIGLLRGTCSCGALAAPAILLMPIPTPNISCTIAKPLAITSVGPPGLKPTTAIMFRSGYVDLGSSSTAFSILSASLAPLLGASGQNAVISNQQQREKLHKTTIKVCAQHTFIVFHNTLAEQVR